jgi:hypothetical protein
MGALQGYVVISVVVAEIERCIFPSLHYQSLVSIVLTTAAGLPRFSSELTVFRILSETFPKFRRISQSLSAYRPAPNEQLS